MITRKGFVSNSSSSSFIIAFDEKPKDAKEVKKILFYNDKNTVRYYDYVADTEDIAEQVFHDIKDQVPLNIFEVEEELSHGWIDGTPDYNYIQAEFGSDEWKKHWKKWEEARKKFHRKKAKELLDEFKGKKLFIVEYADEDGSFGCVMEHGDIFENIPHFRISKH